MTKINFTAYPGLAIIESLEEKNNNTFIVTGQSTGRIVKGRIVAMGPDDTTMTGELIKSEKYGKVGDIVWFLHYAIEGGADLGTIEGKQYIFCKWGDLRAKAK
jgi:co-chaperonin GroES (HSP10)